MMSMFMIGGIIFMLVVTTLGNVMVCFTIYKDPRLHRVENAFHISLAVADLMMAFLIMTVAGVTEISGRWIFNEQLCDVWIAVDYTCSTASIFNLCAIAFDKYLHIKEPYRYLHVLTKRVVVLSIVGIWVLAALLSSLPVYFWVRHSGPNFDRCDCLDDANTPFIITTSIVSFVMPCLVMLAMYGRLYLLTREHLQTMAQLCPGQRPQRDYRAALTIGIIMGFFLVCWTPYFGAHLLLAFKFRVNKVLLKVFCWLGYANSMVDPYIYTCLNTELRQATVRTFHKQFVPCSFRTLSKIPSKADTTTTSSVV